MDIENIGPGPDIDNLDVKSMDRGDTFGDVVAEEKTEVKAEEKTEEKVEEKVEGKGEDKGDDKADEGDDDGDDDGDGQPREKDGKFAKRDKAGGIPKARFDEAVAKEREAREAAERRARELEERLRTQDAEQRAQVASNAQLKALEGEADDLTAKYNELLLDGQKEEAAKVMSELRRVERNIARLETEVKTDEIVSKRLEGERVKLVVAKLESDHPQFNPDSESYDDDLVQMVLMFQSRYVQMDKLSPSAAMEKAAQAVLEKFNMTKKGAADEKKEEKVDVAAEKSAQRVEAAARKALDASKSQPPTVKDVGLDSDALGAKKLPDVSKMTAAEFAALPESTRARLRGDEA